MQPRRGLLLGLGPAGVHCAVIGCAVAPEGSELHQKAGLGGWDGVLRGHSCIHVRCAVSACCFAAEAKAGLEGAQGPSHMCKEPVAPLGPKTRACQFMPKDPQVALLLGGAVSVNHT